MNTNVPILLIAGLIFPIISLLSGIASLVHRWRHGRHASPVFVPFVGPILLTCWVVQAHEPLWLIPVVWILDIGTLAFLAITPRLIAEWWRVSSFTRVLSLHGTQDIQSALISLHSTGHYVLMKSWKRTPAAPGIVSLGEPGTYTCIDTGYALTSFHGLQRTLRRTEDGTYTVEEDQPPREELAPYSICGWRMTTQDWGRR